MDPVLWSNSANLHILNFNLFGEYVVGIALAWTITKPDHGCMYGLELSFLVAVRAWEPESQT